MQTGLFLQSEVFWPKEGLQRQRDKKSWWTGVSGNRVFPILVADHTSVELVCTNQYNSLFLPPWLAAGDAPGLFRICPHLTQAVTRNSSLSAVQCLTCSGVFPSVSARRFPGEFGRRCQFLDPAWRGSQGLLASCILNMVSRLIALTLFKGGKWLTPLH